ncbi:mycobactin polyketide synthase MbtD [Mycolicibacterium sp. XJ2546]
MQCRRLPDGRVPVVLSAHAEELIAADAEAVLHYLDGGPELAAVAATLLRTRRLRRHRAVLRAADIDELADGLRALSAGADHPLVARSSEISAARTAFVLPGQGNQWPTMGAEAYHQSPVYRAEVDRCAAAFLAARQPSPLPYLIADTDGGAWSQVQIQAAQFTHAAGLAQVWRSCGIEPAIAVGHSLGEIAAAYIAGAMTLPDAAAAVIARAEVVDTLSGDYRMAVLGTSVEDAQHLIATVDGWLEISAVNSLSSVVVSGHTAAVETLVVAATQRGLFVRTLDVNYPGHTSALEPLRDALTALLPHGQFDSGAAEFIGSATADIVPAGTDFVDYWYRNLRNTVRFDRAAVAAHQRGATRFVELSAHPSLLFALGDLFADEDPPFIVGSGQRGALFGDAMAAAVISAAVADPAFRWADLVNTDIPVQTGFPNAPMRSVRLWATPQPLAPIPGITVADEQWVPRATAPAGDAVRRIAVVELVGHTGHLGDRLRDAVHRHPGAEPAAPADADVLVAVAPVLDHPGAELAAQEIGNLVDAGLLDYVEAAGSGCATVCLVTVGGEHVRPDEPVGLPAQSALAAMHRSIGLEHPDQTFRRIDLPSWEIDDATAAAAVDAALGDGQDAAVRDGTTYVRTVTESAQAAVPWPLGDGVLDDVVITGGNGNVGLHFARHLAERGARRIVLVSRSGIDETTRAGLGPSGVEIVDARCDITSAEQLSAAAQEHAEAGATLLIHAAGAATFAERTGITGAAFADTAAAKVHGLARMMASWPLRTGARIVLCSSISGVWGGRGHGAYSAANRMLDVMAGQLRAKGQRCVAVRYGLWHGDPRRGSGIAGLAGVGHIERAGLLPMAPEMAVAASLCDYDADPLLMAADPERLRVFLDNSAVSESPGAAAELGAKAGVADRVVAALTAVLKTETIAPDMSLLDLGLDSLLALDLRKRLLRTTDTKVALATLLGGITASELIDSLDSRTGTEKVETTRD